MFSQQQSSRSPFVQGQQSQEPEATTQQQQTSGFNNFQPGAQQTGSFGSFGVQQQAQQGQLFQQQPQQQPPAFGRQFVQQPMPSQQQQSLFGSSSGQPFQQQQQQGQPFQQEGKGNVDSMGTDGSSNVKWIPASNGHIPEGAVVGGWSSTTQEPYYIARAKRDKCLYPGIVLKSKKVCSFVSSQKNRGFGFGASIQTSSCDTNPNYEILVEDEKKEKGVAWVYLSPSKTNNTFLVNCTGTRLKVGYDLQGSSNFIGRAPSITTGDLIPGELKGNTILITEDDHFSANNIYHHGCEILCISPQDSDNSEISNCYLYDIEYDNIDKRKCISLSNKMLGRVVLTNNSSVKQKMTPSFRVTYNTGFKWELSQPDSKYKQVEIKSEVPFVNGYSQDGSSVIFLNSQSFYSQISMGDITGFGGNNSVHNIHGGRLPLPGGGGGVFGGGAPFGGEIPNVGTNGIFTPTVAIVDDLSSGLHYKKRTTCSNTSFTVPSVSKVTVEYTGQEVTLSVPFKATLKIIYRNDCVHDEEVHGTYKHTSITASFPTIVGEKTTLY